MEILSNQYSEHQVFKNASPSVVWIGDDVYERVGCKGRHDEDVGDSVAPLGQTRGRKQEVRLVVESEDDGREGTDHVADEHPRNQSGPLSLVEIWRDTVL